MLTFATMPRILIIAYYFPPWGMGGVQRVLKFAKYLPEFGWNVTVIAPEAGGYLYTDPSLLADLPTTVKVERVPDAHGLATIALKSRMRPLLRWLSSWRDLPDRHRNFATRAARRADELLREDPFDVVLTSSPPPSVHITGLKLRRNVAWVADFRDPWQALADDYGPSLLHHLKNSTLHRKVLQSADAVIAVTPELRRHFEAMCRTARVTVIRNGYDEADFTQPLATESTEEALHIVVPGTISRFSDPRPAFKAISAYREAHRARPITVSHVGATMGFDLNALASQTGLRDVFRDVGYQSHADALQVIRGADLLMLSYNEPRVTDVSVPGRIYEMLRSQKPIVALTPSSGALANLLAPIPGCEIVSPADTRTAAQAIETYANPEARTPRLLNSIRNLDRRAQAQELSQLCHTVMARRSSR